jgi:Tol biopolymer transport system component
LALRGDMMDYLNKNKIKILIGLIILLTLFHVYKFFQVRLVSLDLPKGKIVFSSGLDGDNEIYTMNINGTNLRQLTKNTATKTNTAADYEPSFSPRGTKIVFISRRLEDGNMKLIYNNRGRVIGKNFSGGAFDVFIMDSDGNNQIPLTYQGMASVPFFSTDGKRIIFRSNKPASLKIMDINTLEQGVLHFGGGQVEFSLDGKKVFDNFKKDISVADIDGINNMVKLTHFSDSQGIRSNGKNGPSIAFSLSPSGEKIAVATIADKNNQVNRLFNFFTMNADGSGLEEIYKLETKNIGVLWDLKYCPTGNSIILDADLDMQGIYSLSLINNNLINLTGEKENWNVFSKFTFTLTPDGKRIIFVANISPKNYNLAWFFYNIKGWVRYLLLWRKTPPYDNKYLCIMDIDGKNYRRIAKLPEGTELGRDFIHWEE